ncbi:MAG: hypothetical protein PUB42_00550 [Firmicutes bacterium]|nr:hypothetical protein [Bacillota bacterium]
MNYNRLFVDFEKRYGEKCRKSYFVGMPLSFFERDGLTMGCAVSIGGCLLLSPRSDGRLMIGFSDTDRLLTCNVNELVENSDEDIFDILLNLKKIGINPGGARMLYAYNTRITHPYLPMTLAALKGFCVDVPPIKELLGHFGYFEKNALALFSRKDTVVLIKAGKIEYYPFPSQRYKIVMCECGNAKIKKNLRSDMTRPHDAMKALSEGNFDVFGRLVTAEGAAVLAANRKAGNVRALFDIARRLGDSVGTGVLDGGIFALVEEERIDTFMHNLGAEFERRIGKRPDFYITVPENSGTETGGGE